MPQASRESHVSEVYTSFGVQPPANESDMKYEHIESDVDALHAFLRDEPTLVVRPDRDYGRLFELSITPCCMPLPVLFWFNAASRGVFVRVVFPPTGARTDKAELLGTLNRINYTLPVGTFAADLDSGEVRFKNAVFLGELKLHVQLLGNLVASSFEMVRLNHSEIIRAMTGRAHTH